MSRPALWPLDPLLYVVTDSSRLEGRSLEETVAAAIRGGAEVIQYREKNASTRRMVEEASALCRLCRREGAVFLVNDRLDVALAVNAHGIHVGREDMPVAVARRILGPGRIVGVSVHDEEDARRAEEDGADYLSVSPVYATSTKPDHETPLGIEGTRKLVQKTGLPVVAIGGIDETNLAGLIECGIQGICVVSAVMAAPDPEEKSRSLAMRIRQAVESLRGG